MKKLHLCLGLTLVALSLSVSQSNAQLLKKLKDKVSNKIESKVDQVLDGNSSATTTNGEAAQKGPDGKVLIGLAGPYNFVSGTDTIYMDSFGGDKLGDMPRYWKTSGSGMIGTDDQFAGNWFYLNPFTTYKLKSDRALPEAFTVEFDILTRSQNEARDLNYIGFGFANDNSVSDYVNGAYDHQNVTFTQLHYWNKEVSNSSSDTKGHNTFKYPLEDYAIGKMHVAITVKGVHMQVYLDKHKILDADMFAREPETKYFYISSPTRLDHNARMAVGNFKIMGIK